MATPRERDDDISIMADGDLMASSPLRSRDQPQASLQVAVKAILEGELAAEIKTVVQQQAALVFGELSDNWETPSTSKASEPVPIEVDPDVKKSRQAILTGGEIVDRFNPDDQDSAIDRWLSKIDQLGVIHRWSEYDRSTIMQGKLAGSARKWYHQLERYDYTWAQWKVLLREAFPRRHDFAVMLEEMLARRKMAGETLTAYYHAKLALCSRVEITGEHAVSCIIRGLPEDLRANAVGCSTPEALYHKFLMGLESDSRERPRRASSTRGTIRCYNCQHFTNHLSRDCPQAKLDRCWKCGEGGHLVKACPKRRPKEGAAASGTKVSLTRKPTDYVFRQRAYIGGEIVCIYIDTTGSVANLMSAPTARHLGLTLTPTNSDVTLGGFGGGVAASLVEVQFDLAMELSIKVTDCDMGRIELLLGQAAIQAPGVVLIVRKIKAV